MFYFSDFFGKRVLKSTYIESCHFFTTRDFVLNCGSCTEMEDEVLKNIDFLVEKLETDRGKLYGCRQRHTSNVRYGEGEENFLEDTDGIVLSEKGSACFLNFADCVPIILHDKRNNIGSVVHAGWRGTASKIVQRAVIMMQKKGAKSQDISCAIGPAIGKCCYKVDKDVFDKITYGIDKAQMDKEGIVEYNTEEDKYFIDLKQVNRILLEQVSIKRIDVSEYCTSCFNEVFFSYRRENKNTARHSAVLKIEG